MDFCSVLDRLGKILNKPAWVGWKLRPQWKTLLHLARQLGKKGPGSTLIGLGFHTKELSKMIGATRPRVSVFIQRISGLGPIELSEERYLIVKEGKLTAYLASIA
jgi:hypothetical protein